MRLWRGQSEVRGNCAGSENVMFSLYVQQDPMLSRLSRTSRGILLMTSVWSVIVIVLAFFITYTVLLVYVDRPFQKADSKQDMFAGSPVSKGRPRIRLLGKGILNGDQTLLNFSSALRQRQKVWDPGLLDDLTTENPKCRHGSLFIILVTSSPDHFKHRTAIRNTWCSSNISSEDHAWQCLFLIGQTDRTNLTAMLSSESLRFGDIIQGSYVDSYRNLTHKVMHGLSWVSRHCPVPFILKTDDDCFVNVVLFRRFLLHHNTKTTSLYAGNLLTHEIFRKVVRIPNEKWFVSEDDYLPEYYPVYARGNGYVLSHDVVSRLIEESRFKKPIPNEDAYIGVVMDSLGVQPTFSGRFTLGSTGLRVCNYRYVFVVHGVQPGMQEELQGKAVKSQSACRDEEEVRGWL